MMRFLCLVVAVSVAACGSGGRGTSTGCTELRSGEPGELGVGSPSIAIEVRFLTVAKDFFQPLGVDFRRVAAPVDDDFPNYGGGVVTRSNIATSATVLGGEAGSQVVVPQDRHVGSFFPAARAAGLEPGLDALTAYVQAPGANDQCMTIDELEGLTLSGPPESVAVRPFAPFGGLPAGQGVAYHLFDAAGLAVALGTVAPVDIRVAPQVTLFNGQRACVVDHSFVGLGTTLSSLSVSALGFLPNVGSVLSGVTLDFKPTLGQDPGSVSLEIRPTSHGAVLQHVGAFAVGGTPVTLQIPILATVAQRTNILVPAGGSVLLGGIKQVADDGTPSVPLLTKLPYVNRLFRAGTATPFREEVMILITPRIIIKK